MTSALKYLSICKGFGAIPSLPPSQLILDAGKVWWVWIRGPSQPVDGGEVVFVGDTEHLGNVVVTYIILARFPRWGGQMLTPFGLNPESVGQLSRPLQILDGKEASRRTAGCNRGLRGRGKRYEEED